MTQQRSRSGALGRPTAATLSLALLLSACAPSAREPSAAGRSRCQQQVASLPALLIRPLAYRRCLAGIDAQLSREQAQQQGQRQRRLQQELVRCRRRQPGLQASLAALRQAERDLAAARVAAAPLLPAPPPPLDEERLARFTREDAELDRQRHAEALQLWRETVAERRERWWQQRQSREAEAQLRLDRAALGLRQQQPDLFSRGIELDPAVARRVLACDPRALAAALPSAAASPAGVSPAATSASPPGSP